MTRLIGILSLLVFLAACTEGFVSFPVTEEQQEDISEDVTIVRIDSSNIGQFTQNGYQSVVTSLPSGRGWDYRIGVGDILNILVFDHPELTLPAGPERSAEESGFRVQADGTFFYPFIKQVKARGLTPEEIRADVTARLAQFIPDPQVEVRVAAYNSQSVVVSGEVNAPNRQALTAVPLSLVEAVNAAGGLSDEADPRYITVQRRGTQYRVDLDGFLANGIRPNNPILRPGDVVNVPRRKVEEAYVLGEISKPAPVDLSLETVTLTQAITRQGGLDEIRADARGVFVFRSVAGEMVVYQLETSSPTGLLLGTKFVLKPQDVVYVVRSPLQRWNDTISRLVPSVRAVTDVNRVTN